MIYFILKKTISEESLSYQNNFQILPDCINAKEFNSFKAKNDYAFSEQKELVASRLEKSKMALASASREGNGCDGVVVSIEACGASGPGSIPGRGPLTNSPSDLLHQCEEKN